VRDGTARTRARSHCLLAFRIASRVLLHHARLQSARSSGEHWTEERAEYAHVRAPPMASTTAFATATAIPRSAAAMPPSRKALGSQRRPAEFPGRLRCSRL
jgi:hypothetical protein